MLISAPDPDPASSDATALSLPGWRRTSRKPTVGTRANGGRGRKPTRSRRPGGACRLATEPVEDHIRRYRRTCRPFRVSSDFRGDPDGSVGRPGIRGRCRSGCCAAAPRCFVAARSGTGRRGDRGGYRDRPSMAWSVHWPPARLTHVYHGGPTIEDLVREELRVLLKGWLEDNLPQLVERLVRAEIEKLVGRSVP